MTTEQDKAAKEQAERDKAVRESAPKGQSKNVRAEGADDDMPTDMAGRVRLPSEDELSERHSGFFDPETGDEVPVKKTINKVPAPDGQGGTVMVDADEPGHPDVTTSPLPEVEQRLAKQQQQT